MRRIRNWKYSYRHLLKWRFHSRPWVLGRHACLGLDVLNELGNMPPVLNVQKGRVDYLLDVAENRDKRARSVQVDPFMARKDIVPLISQEEHFLTRPKHAPSLVYMDSYSELTDQLFIHRKDQWKFCCNYTDLNHTDEFGRSFEKMGLLSLETLKEHYVSFFTHIRQLYGNVPIVFLHFPIKLDSREKFKIRHEYILSTITQLAGQFSDFHSIAIDEDVVDWPEERPIGLETFPYHYNKLTYSTFAAAVRATGVLTELCY